MSRFRSLSAAVAAAAVAVLAAMASGCGGGSEPSTVSSPDGSTPSSTPTTALSASSVAGDSSTTTPATTAIGSASVMVYFAVGDGTDCGEVAAFPRPVDADDDPVRAAFEGLVAGPTEIEATAGAHSVLDGSTADGVRWAGVVGDLLTVDLDAAIRSQLSAASSSCGSETLLAQLAGTAFQFSGAERARFQVGGSCDLFAELVQRACFELRRDGTASELPLAERASGSGCTPGTVDGLPDGRWYGVATSLDPSELSFDLACWFDGEAAAAAAAEDGGESPPPNDYFVRDGNPLERTLAVVPGAAVTWYPDAGDPSAPETVVYERFGSLVAERGVDLALWLTVADGRVVAIEEQWTP
ncbi:MAG: GerMN domain-containing protein [Acidimicrobiales bacterium]